MERKLKSLKAQRTSFVSKIDLLLEFAKNVSDEAILEGVQARLISMRETLREFKEVERDLISTNPDEPLEINAVEEKCFDIEAKLGSWLRIKSTESSLNLTLPQNDPSHICRNGSQELKLTKSAVPIFSGDYSEWHTFYDLYCANIHDRTGLTPSQKFQFLCGYLRGEASNLIKHLRITDANYNEAIHKLRERYSRKKQIVNSFVGTFLDQPTIGVPSAGSIRKLLDTSDEILRGIRAIGTEAEKRDPWIIRIILNKLDNDTKSKWLEQTRDEDFPTINNLLEFLQNRVDDLENIQSVQSVKRVNQHSKPTIRGHIVSKAECCPVCTQQDHVLYKCPTFNGWSIAERRKKIQSERLCYNCFQSNHGVVRCTSKVRCSSCGRKHNTLLHEELLNGAKPIQSNVANEEVESNEQGKGDNKIVMGVEVSQGYNQVVLPTAIVYISSDDGQVIGSCRALLDCGSQASFVCESLVQRCKLRVKQKAIPVAGLSDTAVGKTRGSVSMKLLNSKYDPVISVEAYVLGKVTVPLPQRAFTTNQMRQFINLSLADPSFNVPGTIEMLLGADQFFNIILDGQIRSDENQMFAQHTKFGWVISGQLPQSISLPAFVGISTLESIDRSLRSFWELERVPTKAHLTLEHEICEEPYRTNFTRNNEGRFIVRIPFKTTPMKLGDNTYEAIRRLRSVEN